MGNKNIYVCIVLHFGIHLEQCALTRINKSSIEWPTLIEPYMLRGTYQTYLCACTTFCIALHLKTLLLLLLLLLLHISEKLCYYYYYFNIYYIHFAWLFDITYISWFLVGKMTTYWSATLWNYVTTYYIYITEYQTY